ncbi:MAG TPA: hypothetical protein ENJ18_16675, partial [Nannocystis exedens]|nr:hypothetical protein [Nannocystis exedens]
MSPSKILVPAFLGALGAPGVLSLSGCVRQSSDTGEEMTTVFSDSDSDSESSGSSGRTTLGTTTSTVTTEPPTDSGVSSTTTTTTTTSTSTTGEPCSNDLVCDPDESLATCLHDCG